MNETFRFEMQRIMDFRDIPEKEDETEDEKRKRMSRVTYAQFHFVDEITHREIYLIANRPVTRFPNVKSGELFATEQAPVLIPEHPQVDYFAQLYGQFLETDLDGIGETLNLIPIINKAHRVDADSLKAYSDLMH